MCYFSPSPIIAVSVHETDTGWARGMWFSYCTGQCWLNACVYGNLLDYLHCIPWAPLKVKEGRTSAINYRGRREIKNTALNLSLRPMLKV